MLGNTTTFNEIRMLGASSGVLEPSQQQQQLPGASGPSIGVVFSPTAARLMSLSSNSPKTANTNPLSRSQSPASSFKQSRLGLRAPSPSFFPFARNAKNLLNTWLLKKPVSVMVTDLTGFIDLSLMLATEELLRIHTAYLSLVESVCKDTKGTFLMFIGDRAFVSWNASSPVGEYAPQACKAALAFRDDFNSDRTFENRKCKVAVATGQALVGNIGSKNQMGFGIIGHVSLIASALCKLNGPLQTEILICSNTWRNCKEFYVAKIVAQFDILTSGILMDVETSSNPSGAASREGDQEEGDGVIAAGKELRSVSNLDSVENVEPTAEDLTKMRSKDNPMESKKGVVVVGETAKWGADAETEFSGFRKSKAQVSFQGPPPPLRTEDEDSTFQFQRVKSERCPSPSPTQGKLSPTSCGGSGRPSRDRALSMCSPYGIIMESLSTRVSTTVFSADNRRLYALELVQATQNEVGASQMQPEWMYALQDRKHPYQAYNDAVLDLFYGNYERGKQGLKEYLEEHPQDDIAASLYEMSTDPKTTATPNAWVFGWQRVVPGWSSSQGGTLSADNICSPAEGP